MKVSVAIAFAASSVAGAVAQSPIGAFGQCGGDVYTGSTTCIQGYECHFYSEYYSQCLPAAASALSGDPLTIPDIKVSLTAQTTQPSTTAPTKKPTTTATTAKPTKTPKPKTTRPTKQPTTLAPTTTKPDPTTETPTAAPTEEPSTKAPSADPTTEAPTAPTEQPTPSTSVPTLTDCTLTGTYVNGTDVSSCANLVISSLQVPAGVTLNLTKLQDGATVTFTGTTTFGTKLWDGPLIMLRGTNLKVNGPGTLDGQGAWYWPQGQSVTRPVFFRLNRVEKSALSGFTIKNMPYRTFSIVNSVDTVITGLTLDSKAGDGLAKNTDGFDLSRNNGVSITNNTVYNQDDCLAMQSSTNTLFAFNTCSGGHGISVGSLGGAEVNVSSTVDGLTVRNNKIIDNTNGLRIKTIIDLKGLVTNVKYIDNTLTNVENAIVMRSDYSKAKGGYVGTPTSQVTISDITISGLTGTATNLYDVLTNPSVVSNWYWSGINVQATSKGSCKGQPSDVTCD
ncbi:hypothetical protein AeMF1_006993 [Aphanomyces euteiches]|nr:hypothetical protein AeMF1_006993 [Aphanomyces euteiches]